jgi:hypothetical protein
VGGDVGHAHIAVRQHHHAVAHAGQVGQHFGMAFERIARHVQRLLAQGGGHDGVCRAALAQLYRACHGTVGPVTASFGNFTSGQRLRDRPDVDHVH